MDRETAPVLMERTAHPNVEAGNFQGDLWAGRSLGKLTKQQTSSSLMLNITLLPLISKEAPGALSGVPHWLSFLMFGKHTQVRPCAFVRRVVPVRGTIIFI